MILLDDLPSLYNIFSMHLMDMLHIRLDSSHLEPHFSMCNIARFYLFHFKNKHTTDATFCIFEKKNHDFPQYHKYGKIHRKSSILPIFVIKT